MRPKLKNPRELGKHEKDVAAEELVKAIREWFRYVEGGYVEKRNSRGTWVMVEPTRLQGSTTTCPCGNASVTVQLHRLIFAWHHGYFPKMIDHIDGNPRNNEINNLRAATSRLNMINRRSRREQYPVHGVAAYRRGGYAVNITRNRRVCLSTTDFESAVFFRLVAEVLDGHHAQEVPTDAWQYIHALNYSKEEVSKRVSECPPALFEDAIWTVAREDASACVFAVLQKEWCRVPKNLVPMAADVLSDLREQLRVLGMETGEC